MEASNGLKFVLKNLLFLLLLLSLFFLITDLFSRHVEASEYSIGCSNEQILVRLGIEHEICGTFGLFGELSPEVVLLVNVVENSDVSILWLRVFEWMLDSEPVDHAV